MVDENNVVAPQEDTQAQPDINEIINKAVTTHLNRAIKKLEKKIVPVQQAVVDNDEEVVDSDPLKSLQKQVERLTRDNKAVKEQALQEKRAAKTAVAESKLNSLLVNKVDSHIAELLIPSLMKNVNVEEGTFTIGDVEYDLETGVAEFLRSEKGSKYVTKQAPMKKVFGQKASLPAVVNQPVRSEASWGASLPVRAKTPGQLRTEMSGDDSSDMNKAAAAANYLASLGLKI